MSMSIMINCKGVLVVPRNAVFIIAQFLSASISLLYCVLLTLWSVSYRK